MGTRRYAAWTAVLALLLLAGCATSPEAESRRLAIEADIQDILSQTVPAELGTSKRCLSDHEYRSFRALNDQYLLFEGRRGKQWINELRSRCYDLRRGHVLMVTSFSVRRICDMDRFEVADWFYWPWYRRWYWPGYWGPSWGMGVQCSLGKFQPVTEAQVAAIEDALDSL
jgi:hypothetical protein